MKFIPFSKELTNKSFVKLCVNKTHMGPSSADKKTGSSDRLSASANKIKLMCNLRLSIQEDSKETKESKPKNSSWLVDDASISLPTEAYAMLLFEAWERKYSDLGTPEYEAKVQAHLKARSEAYEELGINPANLKKDKKPELSADQRGIYNKLTKSTSFDYYEYHLSFKQEGLLKFIRTSTYRSLKPLEIEVIGRHLDQIVSKDLQGIISINLNDE